MTKSANNQTFNGQMSGMDPVKRIEWLRQNSRETHDTAVKCLQTNYYGAKHVTEALLPLLQSSSDGRVVNVSSGFGLLRVKFDNLITHNGTACLLLAPVFL